MSDPEDEVLDARGLSCPQPILMLTQAMKSLGRDMVLKLLADDPAAYEDVQVWCRRTGNHLVSIEENEGLIVAFIRKG